MMDEAFTLTPRLQFHLLRHFTEPDRDYTENLATSYGCSPGEVKKQLQLPGSKFHPAFARDPLELWDIIKNLITAGNFRASIDHNRKIFSFNLDPAEYPDGIGTRGLLAMSELTPEEGLRVVRQERDGFFVLVISGPEPRITHEMHLVILLTDDPFITTIYPGMYAPPFPDARHQDPGEFRKNLEFWNQNVFIA
jgi:hypothetical protein